MKYKVKVHPGAKKEEVLELGAQELRVKLNQIAEKGKANQALIKTLAQHFQVKRNQVSILSGLKQKNKIVSIDKTS